MIEQKILQGDALQDQHHLARTRVRVPLRTRCMHQVNPVDPLLLLNQHVLAPPRLNHLLVRCLGVRHH
jgi:hypothetical protein